MFFKHAFLTKVSEYVCDLNGYKIIRYVMRVYVRVRVNIYLPSQRTPSLEKVRNTADISHCCCCSNGIF